MMFIESESPLRCQLGKFCGGGLLPEDYCFGNRIHPREVGHLPFAGRPWK